MSVICHSHSQYIVSTTRAPESWHYQATSNTPSSQPHFFPQTAENETTPAPANQDRRVQHTNDSAKKNKSDQGIKHFCQIEGGFVSVSYVWNKYCNVSTKSDGWPDQVNLVNMALWYQFERGKKGFNEHICKYEKKPAKIPCAVRTG